MSYLICKEKKHSSCRSFLEDLYLD